MSRSNPQLRQAETLGMDYVFKSGKYANRSVAEVLELNSGYILWLAENTDLDFHHTVIEQAEEDPRIQP